MSSPLKLPTGEDVAAARENIRGSALRTPAGAPSLAAAMAGRAGRGTIVFIISGGNIDAAKLGAILDGKSSFRP